MGDKLTRALQSLFVVALGSALAPVIVALIPRCESLRSLCSSSAV
jgi:hypothetical protein